MRGYDICTGIILTLRTLCECWVSVHIRPRAILVYVLFATASNKKKKKKKTVHSSTDTTAHYFIYKCLRTQMSQYHIWCNNRHSSFLKKTCPRYSRLSKFIVVRDANWFSRCANFVNSCHRGVSKWQFVEMCINRRLLIQFIFIKQKIKS